MIDSNVAARGRHWHRRCVMSPHRRALASLAVLALAACQDPPSLETQATPRVEAPPPSPAPSLEPPAPPPNRAPSLGSTRLYLAIDGPPARLVRFDDRGAAVLPTPTATIADLFEGPDNTVYLRDEAALHRIENEQLREVVRFPAKIGAVHHLAVGRDLSLWVVADRGIGMLDGDTWKPTPLDELELDSTAKLAFDSEQRLWAVAPERALYLDGERWIPAPLELLAPGYALLNPLGSPVGRVHVSNRHLMTRLGKQDFESIIIDGKNRFPYTADLDIAPDGYACVSTATCDLACANAQPPTTIWRYPGRLYSCDSLYQLAVEASHRVWAASPLGLHLVLPDREAHEFPIADYPALAGTVTDMVAIE